MLSNMLSHGFPRESGRKTGADLAENELVGGRILASAQGVRESLSLTLYKRANTHHSEAA